MTATPASTEVAAIICVRPGEGRADWSRWIKHAERLKGRFTERGEQAVLTFDSPMVAVACAATVQLEIKRDQAAPESVGIDYGDVGEDQSEPAGAAMTLAARLCDAAPSGEVYLSGAVHERLRGQLPLAYATVATELREDTGTPLPVYRVRERRLGMGKAIRTDASPARRRAGVVVAVILFLIALVGVAWQQSRAPGDGAIEAQTDAPQ